MDIEGCYSNMPKKYKSHFIPIADRYEGRVATALFRSPATSRPYFAFRPGERRRQPAAGAKIFAISSPYCNDFASDLNAFSVGPIGRQSGGGERTSAASQWRVKHARRAARRWRRFGDREPLLSAVLVTAPRLARALKPKTPPK